MRPQCPHCGCQVLEWMPGPGDILGCEHCARVFERREAERPRIILGGKPRSDEHGYASPA